MASERKPAKAKGNAKTPAKPYEPTLREREAAAKAREAKVATYIGGLRRFKAQVNNDGGAVPIWELEQNNPSNEGNAA